MKPRSASRSRRLGTSFVSLAAVLALALPLATPDRAAACGGTNDCPMMAATKPPCHRPVDAISATMDCCRPDALPPVSGAPTAVGADLAPQLAGTATSDAAVALPLGPPESVAYEPRVAGLHELGLFTLYRAFRI